MRRSGFVVVTCVAAVLVGCGRQVGPSAADITRGQDAVRTMLETWKNGESPKKLATLETPIQAKDDDWSAGFRLTDFELTKAEGQGNGNVRCFVALSLQPPRGQPMRKEVVYDVLLATPIVIGRDPFF